MASYIEEINGEIHDIPLMPSRKPKEGYKWVMNLRSHIWVQIPTDTPRCADPSTELYWSM